MSDKGVLIFAHNNRKIDYFKLAMLSGVLANKKLNLPVSIVTDVNTLSDVRDKDYFLKYSDRLDQIIEIELDQDSNFRNYRNGTESDFLQFKNSSRCQSWEVSPYDRTLLLDSDYLTLSSNLNSFFNVNSDLMIAKSYNDVMGEKRIEYNNIYVSSVGIELKWATTVLFSKNEKTKLFFELVKHIHKNYFYYSRVYRFDSRLYRNDIAFSLALHILNGYTLHESYELPSVLSILGTDSIFDVRDDKIFFLIDTNAHDNKMISLSDQDIHVMNKLTLLEHFDELINL